MHPAGKSHVGVQEMLLHDYTISRGSRTQCRTNCFSSGQRGLTATRAKVKLSQRPKRAKDETDAIYGVLSSQSEETLRAGIISFSICVDFRLKKFKEYYEKKMLQLQFP